MDGKLVHLHGDAHEQTLKLLPWYLNGTLDDGEAAMVEAHLIECAACSREAEMDRNLRTGVGSLGVDVDQGWQAMRDRLAGAAVASPPLHRRPFWRRRIGVGWAAGGMIAASFAAATVVTLQPQPTGNIYRALGTPAAPAREQANAIVLFAPNVTTQVMRDAFNAADARITDGPLASGGFMVRVAPATRHRTLGQLRAVSGVVMAEPIDAANGE